LPLLKFQPSYIIVYARVCKQNIYFKKGVEICCILQVQSNFLVGSEGSFFVMLHKGSGPFC